MLHRRGFVLGSALGLLGEAVCANARAGAVSQFAALEKQIGGRVGASALDTGSGARIAWRGGERFAMCSTFKWLLAAAILSYSERGRLALGQRIAYTAADLLPHAPVTAAHLRDGGMTIDALCEAAIEVSDNTAANALLRLVGGAAGLTRFLRATGDPVTRLDRTELALNTNLPGDPRDTTTPDAMINTMRRILLGDVLQPFSRDRLIEWMTHCRTGAHRLRAGLPRTWRVADKTGTGPGTGPTAAVNDSAIAWPPGRKPILIAAYFSGSPLPSSMQDAAHAKIGRIVVQTFA